MTLARYARRMPRPDPLHVHLVTDDTRVPHDDPVRALRAALDIMRATGRLVGLHTGDAEISQVAAARVARQVSPEAWRALEREAAHLIEPH
jgi:hypothetical protein